MKSKRIRHSDDMIKIQQKDSHRKKSYEKDFKKKGNLPPPVPMSATKPAYASNQDKPTF